ncbi:acid phosphatase [Kwoniella heveanensis CBS 569]|nr:acid phosphatase [Kwoniella heveanensis CBS 569]
MANDRIALALIPLLFAGSAQALTHYPPSNTANTDLAQVINGSGALGIFYSSETPDDQYGMYNWCHVPSAEYELQYVEVIQRHHKRTPYASNTFFKEDIEWDCTQEGPYHYAKDSVNQDHTSGVVWQRQTGSDNPFEQAFGPGFVGSTCQFPSITSEGIEDAYIHGKDLRELYGDKLQFLPHSDEKEKYVFRVTANTITSHTLGGLGKGLFPDLEEHVGWIQDASYDSLAPALTCKLKDEIATSITDMSAEWGNHLNQTLGLRERFNNVSGIEENDTAGWRTSWDHPYDNMSAKQCHGKPLPCSTNNTAICVPQEDADSVYRLGQFEYAYRWRMHDNSTLYSALTMGPWFVELQSHFRSKMDGRNPVKYFHNFAHDGSIAPVLGLLQHDEPVWPGMGSEVVFELYKKDDGAHFVRVLFSGQPLKTSTPLGTLEMVPYQQFQDYLKDTIPDNLVEMCNSVSEA